MRLIKQVIQVISLKRIKTIWMIVMINFLDIKIVCNKIQQFFLFKSMLYKYLKTDYSLLDPHQYIKASAIKLSSFILIVCSSILQKNLRTSFVFKRWTYIIAIIILLPIIILVKNDLITLYYLNIDYKVSLMNRFQLLKQLTDIKYPP